MTRHNLLARLLEPARNFAVGGKTIVPPDAISIGQTVCLVTS